MLSVVGMACISLNGELDGYGLGYVLALCSSFTYATFIIGSERCRPVSLGKSALLTWMAAGALVWVAVWTALGYEVIMPSTLWLWGIYTAYSALVGMAFACLNAGIGSVGAVTASFVTLAEPVATALAGVLFSGDRMTRRMILGFCPILVSVWLNSLPVHRSKNA